MSIGSYSIESPVKGQWNLPDFPPRIVWDGAMWVRADVLALEAWPFYPNVVEQYREDAVDHVRHMLVYADRHFGVDHIDEKNPRYDLPGHIARDATAGQIIACGLLVLGVIVLIGRS